MREITCSVRNDVVLQANETWGVFEQALAITKPLQERKKLDYPPQRSLINALVVDPVQVLLISSPSFGRPSVEQAKCFRVERATLLST